MNKIPIYDLLVFLDEKSDTFERKTNILEFIKDHYKNLTNMAPKFSTEYAIETLCFCDNGLISNGNFPIKEGILLKNKKGEYALTFCGQHILQSDFNLSSNLWIWKLNEKGMLISDTFNAEQWFKWGALTALYSYNDYDEGIDQNLGSRDLKRGMIGKDVLIIQQYLSQYDADIPLSGEFEEKTEAAIKSLQRMHFYHADVDGVVKPKHLDIYLR